MTGDANYPVIPPYARRRMAQRGIAENEVIDLVRFGQPFTYNQHDVEHLGYYDKSTRLFVGVVERVVVTAFKARPQYVEGLRRRAP
jgi:hypothetical protein